MKYVYERTKFYEMVDDCDEILHTKSKPIIEILNERAMLKLLHGDSTNKEGAIKLLNSGKPIYRTTPIPETNAETYSVTLQERIQEIDAYVAHLKQNGSKQLKRVLSLIQD